MAKIKLDLEASDRLTYDRIVDIPTPDGKPLKVTFTFLHRDREAIAALFDAYREKAREEKQADQQDVPSAEAVRQAIDNDVETLQDIATGWNIDAPFDAEHLRKLCTKYAGAALAVVTDYRISLTQGRLGN